MTTRSHHSVWYVGLADSHADSRADSITGLTVASPELIFADSGADYGADSVMYLVVASPKLVFASFCGDVS